MDSCDGWAGENRVWTTDLVRHTGERVRLQGWLHRLRRLSGVSFLILRDGRGLAQVVILDPAQAEQLAALNPESVLAVEGTVAAVPRAPGGAELHEPRIEVIAPADEPPPFELFRPALTASLPAMLDSAAVSLRHARQRATARLAAASLHGFRATLGAHGFVEVQTPKIVANATESGASVFVLDYFGRPAYLAQSPQFYKQIMVGVFERVFETGPVFRAEPHDTARHLNEFVSLDAEFGFIADQTAVMAVLTEVVRGMRDAVRDHAPESIGVLGLSLPDVPAEIPRLHFSEALELISRAIGEDVTAEPDLAPAHERWLGEWAQREHGSDLLFVWGQPMVKRPFYTHPDPERPGYSYSFDLLFRGLELVTGGQRLHRYDQYLDALARIGQDPAPLDGYLQAFKHGMPPHGGFAIGLERWVARLTGAANLREVTLFPRDMHRLTP